VNGCCLYQSSARASLWTGLSKYWANCVTDNLYIWALWVPGDAFVYAAPLWMRLPLNHGISFLWTCYLSFLRGGSADAKKSTLTDEFTSPAKLTRVLTTSTPALPMRGPKPGEK